MTTKPAAKKTPAKKPAKKILVMTHTVSKAKQQEEFRMPMEVKEWIDQASSRLMSMRTEIDRLKEDNQKLRRANKIMEQRVMGMSTE